ncbi:MAG: membrane protein insertion efficiency factor YidD [Pseudomonadota bacterium]
MRTLRIFLVWMLCLPIRAYRLIGSPWVGRNCRYLPTCSEYALEALQRHGPVRGLYLALRRISRCHPAGGDGYDPVPPVKRPRGKTCCGPE